MQDKMYSYSMSTSKALSVFVACFNEEENISATLDNVRDALANVNINAELIIIDDASIDQSPALISEWVARNSQLRCCYLQQSSNRGLAANFLTASGLAQGEWFRMVCGDDVEPRDTLRAIFARLGEADIILPYHIECPGKAVGRKLISTCYTMLVNVFSGH